MYKIPQGQLDLAKLQEEVLKKWKEESSFKKSVENRDTSKEFVFYDGPPFANGLPHYGHLLTSYVKDSVARFQTMIGNRTERRFGWDCHGLPAEMETEKELKVSGRTQIIEYGIDKFNEACRASVMKYSKQWEEYINKAGRWVDFEEDYKTMDKPYMESVLWGFKELYKKGLIYEDFRVMPYSWKCETPLSNFETRMDNSYRSHTSKTATVKIKLKTDENFAQKLTVFALIWTTTPWTLPSNLAIAINKNIDYVVIQVNENEAVLISKKLAHKYEKELGTNIINELKGEELLGMHYYPLFDFFANSQNAFKIINGDFVEEDGGTGLVHIAPGFGEDDWNACKKEGIGIVCPVDDSGSFTQDLYPYSPLNSERLEFENITEKHNNLIKELLSAHTEMHFDNAESSFEFYQKHLEKFGVSPMVAIKKDTKEVIGIAGILAHDDEKPLTDGNIEILCFLKDKFQGLGFGSEIFKHFAKFSFVRFKAESVLAVVMEGKNQSVKTLQNIGFEKVGDVLDARTNIKIIKFVLNKNPSNFKYKNFEFKKNATPYQGYSVFEEGNLIGIIDITADTLNYELRDDIAEEVIQEFIARFEYKGLTCNKKSDFLKKLGFYETKLESGEKLYKKPSSVLNLGGRQVFEVNEDVISFLKQEGLLIKQEQYIHNYPHCWRTDTPLIYKAVSSWYVEVSRFKDRMVELNKQINWMPSHVKEGQFGKWLENARDWSITRNRFWGTPVPIWKVVDKKTKTTIQPIKFSCMSSKAIEIILKESGKNGDYKNSKTVEFFNITASFENGTTKFFAKLDDFIEFTKNTPNESINISFNRNYVFGSIEELNTFFGSDIKDLHRPFIDELIITDPYNQNQEIIRVSDVLDCWFESGSMPFASVHYPFENKEWFESHNPADFIVEYVAQTRGWFYTLMVLSTAIFDRIPFKNCICHGVILDENGQKLSKRLKNYPDPLEVFNTYGSDAMRFFLLSSEVVSGGDLNISKDGAEIRDVVRLVIKPIWNAYTFFAMYANADKIEAKYDTNSKDILDIYILSKLNTFSQNIKFELEHYQFPEACKEIENFLDILNNWYIRRNKERFWKEERDEDKISAYNTLWTVLYEFCKIVSPILPFTAESLFTHLSSN